MYTLVYLTAQTNNRETEPQGLGWELFKNYVIALEKYKPDYFLYENNKSMSPAIKAQITRELGIEPIMINSALVSAQNRQRYYWTNIPGVEQPQDLGILLRDVLETGEAWREKAYCLDANYWKTAGIGMGTQAGLRKMAAESVPAEVLNINPSGKGMNGVVMRVDSKSRHLTTNKGEGAKIIEPVIFQRPHGYNEGGIKYDKSPTLTANGSWENNNHIVEWWDGKTYPVYEVHNGLITIKDKTYPIKLADGYYIIRKLTVTECKRLQTVPDDYIMPCSATQNYKMLGNGWTVDVIAHILSYTPDIKTSPVEVLSMYDGMSCGHIALDKLGANVTGYYATEIDDYAIKTTQANYPDTVQLGDAFRVREDGWSLKEREN